jgi:hypothetical protein
MIRFYEWTGFASSYLSHSFIKSSPIKLTYGTNWITRSSN